MNKTITFFLPIEIKIDKEYFEKQYGFEVSENDKQHCFRKRINLEHLEEYNALFEGIKKLNK